MQGHLRSSCLMTENWKQPNCTLGRAWEGPWVDPFVEYYTAGKKNEADLNTKTRNIFKAY